MPYILLRLGTLVASLCCAGAVSAAVTTYDIRGTIVGSPLDGQDFGGHFSAAEGPDELLGTARPLVDLEFQFDGVSYTEDDVRGLAAFGVQGVRTLFGTACGPNPLDPANPNAIACDPPVSGNGWVFGASNGGAGLSFYIAGTEYSAPATLTQREPNPVPEPASLALVLAALAGITLTRRPTA